MSITDTHTHTHTLTHTHTHLTVYMHLVEQQVVVLLCPIQCTKNPFPLSSDRFRTTVNVLGDSFGVGIVHHYSRKQLSREPPLPSTPESSQISTPAHKGDHCLCALL